MIQTSDTEAEGHKKLMTRLESVVGVLMVNPNIDRAVSHSGSLCIDGHREDTKIVIELSYPGDD